MAWRVGIVLAFIGLIGMGVPSVFAPDWLVATQSRVLTEADETVFPEPETVSWNGRALGPLAGGRGWAFERLPAQTPTYFQVYLASGQMDELAGNYTVHGVFSSIDCAYALTIFEGQCTPVIELHSFEPLP